LSILDNANALKLAAAKDFVLVAAGAIRASKAADEEYCHTSRNQDGEDASMDHKPMHQVLHTR
jgi:hypothetical protein